MTGYAWLAVLISGGVGAVLAWLWQRGQALQKTAQLEATLAAQAQLQAQQHGEWQSQRQQWAQQLQQSQQQLALAQQGLQAAQQDVVRLQTQLTQERSHSAEKLALLNEAKTALSDQFKALANDILEDKSKRFAEQNQTQLGHLLDPLRQRLSDFQAKVDDVYVKEGQQRSALAEQVKQLMALNQTLSADAQSLTRALKGSNKAQGNWGELILERVLEASGLRKGHEYDTQASHTREDGSRAQPDVVVHLPENRHLVIDAKVSLTAYEACVNAETEAERQAAIKRHLESVRTHIKGLGERDYPALYGLGSLDFVLMFVPVEPAFMLAVTHDNALFMDAWQKNVLLVSPSTLLFVVRTVAHLWRQEAQSRNAQDIAKRGAELYDKLAGFVEDLNTVGQRLEQAQKAYDSAHKKLASGRGNVLRQAEMLRALGVQPTKSLAAHLQDDDGPARLDA